MRSFLLASIAALAFPACVQDISGGGPGGGSDTGPACGNGVVEAGEVCDDGNANNGDGCSSSCQTENTTVPRVVVSVDNATVTSDLGVQTNVVVTATSEMGFTGAVTLAATSDVADWKAALSTTSLTLSAGGTATAMLSIRAMGDTAGLTGNVKITAADSGPASDVSVAAAFNPVLDVIFRDVGGVATYDTDFIGPPKPYKLKAGRGIKVMNGSATASLTVHVDAGIMGFPHEGPQTAPGGAYSGTTVAADAGKTVGFYTHNGGTVTPIFLDASGSSSTTRPVLAVVQ